MFRRGRNRGRHAGDRSPSPAHGKHPLHLDELKAGETARIISFHGGRHFREKMSGMGLFPGIEIEVIQTDGEEGMMLISVGGTRLMLCRRNAARIHLEKTR
jgi:Fe2+ transport system protein FeoA